MQNQTKWTVLLSGGPLDNPWDKEVEVEADTLPMALAKIQAGEGGASDREIDAIVRTDLWEDLHK